MPRMRAFQHFFQELKSERERRNVRILQIYKTFREYTFVRPRYNMEKLPLRFKNRT